MAPANLEEMERITYKTHHKVEELEREVETIRGMMESQRQVEEQAKDTDKQLADALGKMAEAMDTMATGQGETQEDVKAVREETGAILTDVRDLISEQEEMKEEDLRRDQGMENTVNLVGTFMSSIKTMIENWGQERMAEERSRTEIMTKQLRDYFAAQTQAQAQAQAQTNRMMCIGNRHSTQCLRMLRDMTQGEHDDSDDNSSTTSDKKRKREAQQKRDIKQKVELWETTATKPVPQPGQPDKPHKCGHCGSSFTQRSSLLRHLKLHCPPDIRYQMLRQGKNVIHAPQARTEQPGKEPEANLQEIPIQEPLREAITKSQTLQEEHKKRNETPDSTRPSPEATGGEPGAGGPISDALAEVVAEIKPFTDTRGKQRSARKYHCSFCPYTSAWHWNVQKHVERKHNKACEDVRKTQDNNATDAPATTAEGAAGGAETDATRSEGDLETTASTQREELIEIDQGADSPGGGEEDDDEDLISDREEEGGH